MRFSVENAFDTLPLLLAWFTCWFEASPAHCGGFLGSCSVPHVLFYVNQEHFQTARGSS